MFVGDEDQMLSPHLRHITREGHTVPDGVCSSIASQAICKFACLHIRETVVLASLHD